MATAEVSSVALCELKNELTKLSTNIRKISSLMRTDMSWIRQTWRDDKYLEFEQSYKTQIQKCEEISIRYQDWCSKVLDPKIETVRATEKVEVSYGRYAGGSYTRGGGISGGGSTGIGYSEGESPNVGEPNMEDLFHKTHPDLSEEHGRAYLNLSPEQRMAHDNEYQRIQDRHDYDVFHAEDRIQMGREISGEGGQSAGAFWAAEGVGEDLVAEKRYQDALSHLENMAIEGAKNNN